MCACGVDGLGGGFCSAAEPAGKLILDESAYCRAYYQFDVQRLAPKPLKAEGEKVLNPIMMGRLRKEVQKRLASKNYDWAKEDWRDHVTVEAEYNSFARKNRVFIRLGKHHRAARGPMGASWSSTIRRGRASGNRTESARRRNTPSARPERNGWLRGVFLRFRFDIPDPAAAGAVTFSADYIGGIRAFVNGREIARGHLPAGDFGAETMAEEYPLEAYVATFADLSAKEKAKYRGKEPPANTGHAECRRADAAGLAALQASQPHHPSPGRSAGNCFARGRTFWPSNSARPRCIPT